MNVLPVQLTMVLKPIHVITHLHYLIQVQQTFSDGLS